MLDPRTVVGLPKGGEGQYALAGLPLSVEAMAGTMGLMFLAMAIELPILAVFTGAFLGLSTPWPVYLLVPARLIGIYGIILTHRQQRLFVHTWLHSSFRHMADLWWAWTLPLIPVTLLALLHLLAPETLDQATAEVLLPLNDILLYLTLLSLLPTWIWCLVRGAMLGARLQKLAEKPHLGLK